MGAGCAADAVRRAHGAVALAVIAAGFADLAIGACRGAQAADAVAGFRGRIAFLSARALLANFPGGAKLMGPLEVSSCIRAGLRSEAIDPDRSDVVVDRCFNAEVLATAVAVDRSGRHDGHHGLQTEDNLGD